MKLFFAVVTLVCAFACTKKVETVNPQITDAVTQSVIVPDAGVAVTGVAVLEEAQALKQEVKEVLQSVSDAGVSVEHQELKQEIEKSRASK
jgi:hypothetical protein